jgi:hypothetical protein
MWNVRTKQIPVVIEENGKILKSFRIYLRNTQIKHKSKEIRKQPHWTLDKYFGEY